MTPVLHTARLTLRPYDAARDEAAAFAEKADADAMRFIGGALDREGFAAWRAKAEATYLFDWTIEPSAGPHYAGHVLLRRAAEGPVAGEWEAGWQVARADWGRGYATEAVAAALDHLWAWTDAPRVIAIVAPGNDASIAVAARLGFRADPALDFDWSTLPPGSPEARRCVFVLDRPGA